MSTTRKIRTTSVGLVAMPADRDEAHVSADDLAREQDLRTAFAELLPASIYVEGDLERWVDAAETYEQRDDRAAAEKLVRGSWDAALDAADVNDLRALRAALLRAREAAIAAGLSTEHEDAALAMLPGSLGGGQF